MSEAAEVVLQAFRAVEGRDYQALIDLYHPEVEFHEAPSLPYGGTSRGKEAVAADLGWLETWGPLQPTEEERRMEPRIISDDGREVVAIYRQRAVDRGGRRLDSPVVGVYEVRDGKFARAQMFHFDTAAILEFLAADGPGPDPSE
jgi:ketosteroid isomerase-like protein